MVKDCDNCIYLGRPSYDYPCTVCESAYGSDPSKWEGVVAATADMVEVVRCKDCKYYEHPEYYEGGTKDVCRTFKRQMQEEDFCSYGEKRMVMGMYESPIKIIYGQMQTQMEGEILKAVMSTDIQVDKEELIRALQYDRKQYECGFIDGHIAAQKELVHCKDCTSWKRSTIDCGWCSAWEGMRYHNNYCNYGERKENINAEN